MKLFNASFTTIFLRYNLLILSVVLPFIFGVPLLALIALPIFLSAILGVSFIPEKNTEVRLLNSNREEIIIHKDAA